MHHKSRYAAMCQGISGYWVELKRFLFEEDARQFILDELANDAQNHCLTPWRYQIQPVK